VFRISPTEFAVVFYGISKERASAAGKSAKSEIENTTCLNENAVGFHFIVKIGVATYPTDGTTESSLMRSARSSLFQASGHL
jgi:GGDEF domain-containing protein